MNHRKNTGHSVSSLFSLLLFGVFVLFLILMLLFSARIYQQTVKQTDSDSELGNLQMVFQSSSGVFDPGYTIGENILAMRSFPVPWMIFLPFVSGTISKEKNISRIFT